MAVIGANTTELEALVVIAEALPKTPIFQENKTVTPTASSMEILPDNGYDALSKVTVNGDSNLVAENIISGKTIFGVAGSANVGVAVQRKSGTFRTSSSGTATVNCGFKPDAVFVTGTVASYGTTYHGGVAFADGNVTSAMTYTPGSSTSYIFSYLTITRSSSGFSVTAKRMSTSFAESNDTNRTFNYIAIKYTE